MQQIFFFLQIFIVVILVIVILLQYNKGASMGVSFGAGASKTMFGKTSEMSFLAKFTIVLSIFLFVNTVILNVVTVNNQQENLQEALPNLENISNNADVTLRDVISKDLVPVEQDTNSDIPVEVIEEQEQPQDQKQKDIEKTEDDNNTDNASSSKK